MRSKAPGRVPFLRHPTPDTSHIHLCAEFKDAVYEPAEDSFLLLDAIEQDLVFLKALNPSLIVDLGSGSGCLGAFVLQLLTQPQSGGAAGTAVSATNSEHTEEGQGLVSSTPARCCPSALVSVDINPTACKASLVTLKQAANRCHYDAVAASLLECIRPGSVDLALFNPPYVPSYSKEVCWRRGSISAAWAGGEDGREVIDAAIPQVFNVLVDRGVLYLLAEARNNLPDLLAKIKRHQFAVTVLLERKCRNERLAVLRCQKMLGDEV